MKKFFSTKTLEAASAKLHFGLTSRNVDFTRVVIQDVGTRVLTATIVYQAGKHVEARDVADAFTSEGFTIIEKTQTFRRCRESGMLIEKNVVVFRP